MHQTARTRGQRLPIRDMNDGKQVRNTRDLNRCRAAPRVMAIFPNPTRVIGIMRPR